MMSDYVLLPAAQEDYEASLNWYLARSLNAAQGFMAAFEEAMILICEHPNRWYNAYEHYHELGLKKYPFRIVYALDEEEGIIVVIRVFHHSRNPDEKYLT